MSRHQFADEDVFSPVNYVHPDEIGPGFIYFFFAPILSRMKIGRTRNSPQGRLDALATGSPEKLLPIMVLRSDMRLEGFLHQLCEEHRVHGEWFRWPDLAPTLTEAFQCYGGDTACEWVAQCSVAERLQMCVPNVEWPTQFREWRPAKEKCP